MGGEFYFFVFLALFFLEESAIFGGPRDVFVSRSAWGGKILSSEIVARGARRLYLLAPVWIAVVFRVSGDAVSFDASGICGVNTQDYPYRGGGRGKPKFIAWEKIESAEERENLLYVNGAAFAKCAARNQAASYAGAIRALRLAERSRRGRIIRQCIKRKCGAKAIRARLRALDPLIARIRGLSFLHFAAVYVAAPLYCAFSRGESAFAEALCFSFAISILYVAAFYFVARKETPRIMPLMLKMLLMFPFASIFAREAYINALAEYNPFAVLLCCSPNSAGLAQANKYLRASAHAGGGEIFACQVARCCKNFNSEILRQITALLKRKKRYLRYAATGELDNLDINTVSYCPRCGCEYIIKREICPECGCRHMISVVRRS